MSYYEPYRSVKKPTPSVSRDLDLFERALRQLQVEYEKFFSGALPLPPEDDQQSLRFELRRLRSLSQLGSADLFRLGGLEARFNSYSELFNRRLRDFEEGRSRRARAQLAENAALDPQAGIVVGGSLKAGAVEALYTGLSRGGAAPKFDLGTFENYLQRQLQGIRQKTGCSEVQFRLEKQDGKIKLKAKPMKTKGEKADQRQET
ncbi:MAG: hypothetical protein K0U98_09965 [Deltaproteobacteria bacterium]|nr:hypothetical protein [Deltaproteobacteria bacterium]